MIVMEIENVAKLSKRQKKVADLLRTGKYSVADLTIMTGYCDIRSYIRELRNKDVNVLDEWVEKDGIRWKHYFIKPNPCVKTSEDIKDNDPNFKNLFDKQFIH